ncbi:hypothetical protein GQ44DRAFT_696868 [Phaeosphaeriaceae sp. PMI808]|nr:hypothetical protein GQ44DRAFT_696868 [Phaeosphaeriaceae sp. PMI808]
MTREIAPRSRTPTLHHHDMAGSHVLHAGHSSHSSHQSISGSRVNSERVPTEDEKSSNKTKHKAHRQHHDHRSRRHAKEVVQSAIQLQPPTSFGDLLKQARGSKDTSPSHSRKGSVARGVDGNAESSRDIGITIPPRRPLRPEEVELEQKRVETRERHLHTALKVLSDQSLKTSRRLDDTYYSILEKASVLRQTIGSLQELSGLTKELHENFTSDTKELVEDVQSQFDGFDTFDTQQQQITGLEERIKAGKQKADSLTDRLTVAKERVEARAQSELEWQANNTRMWLLHVL